MWGCVMKFSSPVQSAEGLTSYAKIKRIRPWSVALNILEGLLGLLGVVVLILVIRAGSFEKAGLIIDQSLGCVTTCLEKLIPHK